MLTAYHLSVERHFFFFYPQLLGEKKKSVLEICFTDFQLCKSLHLAKVKMKN